MARKLTASTAITGAAIDPINDALLVVDVSDSTDSATGTTKKTTVSDLLIAQGGQKLYNVQNYGAYHDYQIVNDAVTNGTTTLTSATATFSSNDTGKLIRVYGAGAAGIDLLTTITYVNATTVMLGTAATSTASGLRIEWGHDDTAAIQSAINAAFVANGGIVYFPNGQYCLFGALQTSVSGTNPNCQIYIPLSSYQRISIKLLGESSSILSRAPFATEADETTGVVLKSMIVGSGTLPSVLGSAWVFDGFVNSNIVDVVIENISIRVKSMVGTTHVSPKMTAFMLYYNESKTVRHCRAGTESDGTQSVQPTDETYGFYLTASGHSDQSSVFDNLSAEDFYYGFRMGEWGSTPTILNAMMCVTALRISGPGGHPIIAKIASNWCTNGIVFDAVITESVNIVYSSEHWPGSYGAGAWYTTAQDVTFTSSTPIISGTIWGGATNAGGGTTGLLISGTNAGNGNIFDVNVGTLNVTTANSASSGQGVNIITNSASTSGGIVTQNKAASGFVLDRLTTDRTSANNTLNHVLVGSTSTSFDGVFGVATAHDWAFSYATGSNNLGWAIGTNTNVPLIFASNGAENMRLSNGSLIIPKTYTAIGTTGNQTINKMSGVINIAAAGTTVTLTNSLISSTSIIHLTLQTADATAKSAIGVCGAGSAVITLNAAATGAVAIGFLITN